MTVSYQYDVASSASGGFIRLLFRWRGSVWKVVYREMFLFTVGYVVLTLLYNFALTEYQQSIFERIVYFCATFMDLIPLSFMLGFYVSFIAARWWSQFIAIPWPDKLMNIVAMYVPGFDEESRVLRRTLMRYLNLSLVLVLRSISMAVKRRFPTKEHLIEAGFMTKPELEIFQSVPSTEFNTFWIPCTWFINVLRTARQECRITDSNGLKLIMEELNEFRSKCGLLWGYDWISIPLVYTQVVTMATYAFYVACMFGRQNVNSITNNGVPVVHRYDYYIPILTILQLMFYMGLLKVAEQLINPFGDDDEDFELNWIIDRHMKVSYLGVDTLNSEPPPLIKDTYYNELDVKIPYTEASKSYKKKTYRGSVAYMQVPMEQQGMVVPEMSEDENDGETASETMGPRRASMYSLFQSRGKSGSFSQLDNRSMMGSVESLWKSSMPNLSAAKNASGTLGFNQAAPCVVDMAPAEEDEIVLQEVIIDRTSFHAPFVQRSDSLQIPGTSSSRVKEPTLSRLLRLSPKIAPKFPREKLKSMFRKRRLSSAFPFYKLKGVRFTKDTKEVESIKQSLLDISDIEPVDVEITLSTPELTEIEKETGVHPYYYTQQTITSAKQLVTGEAIAMRQTNLARSESEEQKFKGHRMGRYLVRSNSLPNISQPDEFARYIQDPIIESSLKKISQVMKHKGKFKKAKLRRKSPSPKPIRKNDISSGDEAQSSSDAQEEGTASRRSTLPHITVTRYDPNVSEHLVSSPSEQSTDQDIDSDTREGSPKRRNSEKQDSEPEPSRTPQQRPSRDPPVKETDKTTAELHSTSKMPRQTSPHRTKFVKETKDDARRAPLRRKSPPPKRPEKLTFTKETPPKKIAGIEIKSTTPTSPSAESAPSSPVSDIPSTPFIQRMQSIPKSTKDTQETPSSSPITEIPRPAIQYPAAQADTTVTIRDSKEDLTQISAQERPPAPPQRHVPRGSGKGKK